MEGISNGADPQRLMPAAITQAAAALYLELRGAELRRALTNGCSLADVAESRGRSLSGLKRALLEALGRMHACSGPTATPVERVVELAEHDWHAWQELVARVIGGREVCARSVARAT